jgi:hypothetical protein
MLCCKCVMSLPFPSEFDQGVELPGSRILRQWCDCWDGR